VSKLEIDKQKIEQNKEKIEKEMTELS